MARFGLIGGSYESQSPAGDAEDTINWMPEPIESDGGRSRMALYPTPGLSVFCDVAAALGIVGWIRGEIEMNGRYFVVCGERFVELSQAGAVLGNYGPITNDGQMVSLCSSQTQILIVSGGTCYSFALGSSAFAAITIDASVAAANIDTAVNSGLSVTSPAPGINAISQDGHIVTVTLGSAVPNDVRAGDLVALSGITPVAFNGIFEILSASGSQFTYSNPTAGLVGWACGEIACAGEAYRPITSLSEIGTTATAEYAGTTLTDPYATLMVAVQNCSVGAYNGYRPYNVAIGNPVSYGMFDSGQPSLGGVATFYQVQISLASGQSLGVSEGQHVVIAGADDAAYNVNWVVSSWRRVYVGGGHNRIYINCRWVAGFAGAATSGGGTITSQNTTPIYAVMGAFCDGYFLRLMPNSQQWGVSALLDCTTWDLTDVSAISVFPDNVVSIMVDHREVWLLGRTKTQVYRNSGNIFPFDPIEGGFIEQGCGAQASPCRADNSIFWAGQDDRGGRMAWRANGYLPQRISTHAVEYAWSQYSTIADAVTWTYQLHGHTLVVFQFPIANATWVYDCSTGLWHKWLHWNLNDGVYEAHLGSCHAYAFGKHLVGDRQSGKVYELATSNQDDAGAPIRRLRRSPSIGNELKRTFHSELQIDLETGLGPIPPLTAAPAAGTGPASFVLASPDATKWTVAIADNGTLTTTPGAPGKPTAVLINDNSSAAGSKTFELVIDNAGVITAAERAFVAQSQRSYAMVTITTAYATGLTADSAGVISVIDPALSARGPQLMVRWSDDHCKTWSNIHTIDCGQAGQHRTRAILRRLGYSRSRVYEISATDAVPWRIIDAYIEASPGYGPTERLVSQARKGA